MLNSRNNVFHLVLFLLGHYLWDNNFFFRAHNTKISSVYAIIFLSPYRLQFEGKNSNRFLFFFSHISCSNVKISRRMRFFDSIVNRLTLFFLICRPKNITYFSGFPELHLFLYFSVHLPLQNTEPTAHVNKCGTRYSLLKLLRLFILNRLLFLVSMLLFLRIATCNIIFISIHSFQMQMIKTSINGHVCLSPSHISFSLNRECRHREENHYFNIHSSKFNCAQKFESFE